MRKFLFISIVLIISSVCVSAQTIPNPPCVDVWGSKDDAKNIQKAMLEGKQQDVVNAVNQAKQTRGNRVGCAETAYTYDKPNFVEPELNELHQAWQKIYAPQLANYKIGCPTAARNWGYFALGGYYARLAGQTADETGLQNIARLLESTQYKDSNAVFPPTRTPGLFGYIAVDSGDACFDRTNIAGTPLGAIISKSCDDRVLPCATFDNGIFAGKRFVIADTEPRNNTYDGGAAYDHAIAGVMMIEASLQLSDERYKKLFRESALLAGDWAIAEPPVRNHNYTAKLVWFLAELYDLTGQNKYKTAMLDKLNRNLKTGVLMDVNRDGMVDGMVSQPFSKLTAAAQRPGRMWDGHNARPTYHAMNTWAFVEAYVALRDRGDKSEAAKVKPFMLAMLDNIAWETNNLGVPNSGRTQIPYALLLALWKVAAVEKTPKPEWEKALRALWNTGVLKMTDANNNSEGSLNTGLYLLYRSGINYVPLEKRSR
jgi:hypothetical protein